MSGFHAQAVKAADEHFKQSQRETLRKLRSELRTVQAQHRQAIAEVRRLCKDLRAAVSSKIQQRRKRALEKLKELAIRERTAARDKCREMISDARRIWIDRADVQRAKLAAERSYQAELKRIEATNRKRVQEHHRTSAAERRSESDDEVRSNIGPDFVALFNRIRGKIKGSSKMSRTDAFLHYVHEHPTEHLEAIEHEAQRELARLQREEREAMRPLRSTRPARTRRPALEAVPF